MKVYQVDNIISNTIVEPKALEQKSFGQNERLLLPVKLECLFPDGEARFTPNFNEPVQPIEIDFVDTPAPGWDTD
jgi:hypothetical protein